MRHAGLCPPGHSRTARGVDACNEPRARAASNMEVTNSDVRTLLGPRKTPLPPVENLPSHGSLSPSLIRISRVLSSDATLSGKCWDAPKSKGRQIPGCKLCTVLRFLDAGVVTTRQSCAIICRATEYGMKPSQRGSTPAPPRKDSHLAL